MIVSTRRASALLRGGIGAAILVFGLASGAAADSKPEHYESKTPASVKEAHATLAESVKTIGTAFRARDFEGVHKASYPAEKAAAVLKEAPSADPGLSEELAHTIEVVHQASEIPSEPILAVAVPALEDVTKKTLATVKPVN
jgi:hypothetical protein